MESDILSTIVYIGWVWLFLSWTISHGSSRHNTRLWGTGRGVGREGGGRRATTRIQWIIESRFFEPSIIRASSLLFLPLAKIKQQIYPQFFEILYFRNYFRDLKWVRKLLRLYYLWARGCCCCFFLPLTKTGNCTRTAIVNQSNSLLVGYMGSSAKIDTRPIPFPTFFSRSCSPTNQEPGTGYQSYRYCSSRYFL